jgi:hypothetical protein
MSMDPQEHKPIDPEKYHPLKSNRKPLDPMKWHRYVYAGADPVNMIDPRGREEAGEEAGAISDAEAAAEEEAYKLKTLMRYRLQQIEDAEGNRGYEINTEGSEQDVKEMLKALKDMWNNK